LGIFPHTHWITACKCTQHLIRVDGLAEEGDKGARELATYGVGQGVGLMNKIKPAREVVLDFTQDYLEAAEHLAGSIED
jgi:hypothetical protein